MKEINGYLLVECPEGAKDVEVISGCGIASDLLHWNQREKENNTVRLPASGNYSIIGLAKNLTEEQWSKNNKENA